MRDFFLIFTLFSFQKFGFVVGADPDCTNCSPGQVWDGSSCYTSSLQFGRDLNTCCVMDYIPEVNNYKYSCKLCRPQTKFYTINIPELGENIQWCKGCEISDCANCSEDLTTCNECKSGFYMDAAKVCQPCPPANRKDLSYKNYILSFFIF